MDHVRPSLSNQCLISCPVFVQFLFRKKVRSVSDYPLENAISHSSVWCLQTFIFCLQLSSVYWSLLFLQVLISNCLSELEAADFADMVSYGWKTLRVETQKSFLMSLITSLSVVSFDILMTHLQSEDYYELRRSYCLLGSCLFYKVRAILCVALYICSSFLQSSKYAVLQF